MEKKCYRECNKKDNNRGESKSRHDFKVKDGRRCWRCRGWEEKVKDMGSKDIVSFFFM